MLPENTRLRQAHTPVSGLCRTGTSDTTTLQTGNRFLLPEHGHPARSRNCRTSQWATIARLRTRGDLRTAGMTRSALGMGEWTLEDVVWCGTDAEEDEEQQSWGWNSPYCATSGHRGAACTAPDAIWRSYCKPCSTAALTVIGASSAAPSRNHDARSKRTLNAPWESVGAYPERGCGAFGATWYRSAPFGHTGATGTVAWADAERQLSCVVLTIRWSPTEASCDGFQRSRSSSGRIVSAIHHFKETV